MIIDESAWPLVTMQWDGIPTDADLTRFLARLDGWLDRGQRFGLLVEPLASGVPTPEQRVRTIGHMKANASRTARLLVQAIVIHSRLQRTLFYGINLIFPNPFPSKVFANADAARLWILDELRSQV
ncbi:MAG TPA: STAS/SEC14 domain-containing protein [Polyangiaceae bacterium]|nr:STAS/SEC14 domain-containing protein [Polyangiaceae bacterium]